MTTESMNKTTPKTMPFDVSKVKPGDEIIHKSYPDGKKRYYVGTTKSGEVAYEYHGGVLTVCPDMVEIIDTAPPRLIPHTMESFDRDAFYKMPLSSLPGGCHRISGIARAGVYFRQTFFSFEWMLDNATQVHPDDTTSPCGREEKEGL